MLNTSIVAFVSYESCIIGSDLLLRKLIELTSEIKVSPLGEMAAPNGILFHDGSQTALQPAVACTTSTAGIADETGTSPHPDQCNPTPSYWLWCALQSTVCKSIHMQQFLVRAMQNREQLLSHRANRASEMLPSVGLTRFDFLLLNLFAHLSTELLRLIIEPTRVLRSQGNLTVLDAELRQYYFSARISLLPSSPHLSL